jgi:redox-sensitive bicupin YhaK (pirin superfamily)
MAELSKSLKRIFQRFKP